MNMRMRTHQVCTTRSVESWVASVVEFQRKTTFPPGGLIFMYHVKAALRTAHGALPHRAPSMHLPLGALRSPCTMCGTGGAATAPLAERQRPRHPRQASPPER